MRYESVESWAEALRADVDVPDAANEKFEDALGRIERGEVDQEQSSYNEGSDVAGKRSGKNGAPIPPSEGDDGSAPSHRASSRARIFSLKRPWIGAAAAAALVIVALGAFGAGMLTGQSTIAGQSTGVEDMSAMPLTSESARGEAGATIDEDGVVQEFSAEAPDAPLGAKSASSDTEADLDVIAEDNAMVPDEADAEPGAKTGAGAGLSNDKIVYTAHVSLETADYAHAKETLRAKVAECGGIVEYETESVPSASDELAAGDAAYLDLTVRVPADSYDAFIAALPDVGVVVSKTANADNISRTYAETEAEIESLKVEQKRLQELLAQADDVEDMITIEERLSDIRAELAAQKNYKEELDTDLAYSTVTVTLKDVSSVPAASAQESLGDQIAHAAAQGWALFTGMLAALLVGLVTLWPLLVIVAIIVIVILAVAFYRRRKYPKP